MTPERLFAALLRLYPGAFRAQFAPDMTAAFAELHRRRGSSIGFWLFVAADVVRSAVREQLDACRSGARLFALQWTGACAAGAIATSLLANALTWTFAYLYHPYLEGVTLPPISYGACLGVGLGVAQAVALRRRFRLGAWWVVVSGAATAVGLEAAVRVASLAGPIGYGIVLGAFIGLGQFGVLRTRVRRAGRWALASTAAMSLALMSSAVTLHTTFQGMNALSRDPLAVEPLAVDAARSFLVRGLYAPATRTDLVVEFAVMAVCGLVMAIVTARPLSAIYAHQDTV